MLFAQISLYSITCAAHSRCVLLYNSKILLININLFKEGFHIVLPVTKEFNGIFFFLYTSTWCCFMEAAGKVWGFHRSGSCSAALSSSLLSHWKVLFSWWKAKGFPEPQRLKWMLSDLLTGLVTYMTCIARSTHWFWSQSDVKYERAQCSYLLLLCQ